MLGAYLYIYLINFHSPTLRAMQTIRYTNDFYRNDIRYQKESISIAVWRNRAVSDYISQIDRPRVRHTVFPRNTRQPRQITGGSHDRGAFNRRDISKPRISHEIPTEPTPSLSLFLFLLHISPFFERHFTRKRISTFVWSFQKEMMPPPAAAR